MWDGIGTALVIYGLGVLTWSGRAVWRWLKRRKHRREFEKLFDERMAAGVLRISTLPSYRDMNEEGWEYRE